MFCTYKKNVPKKDNILFGTPLFTILIYKLIIQRTIFFAFFKIIYLLEKIKGVGGFFCFFRYFVYGIRM
jgi:hypothetical protein